MLRLALIIVTHNSARWLRPCVESWGCAMKAAPQVAAAEILIADSGSTDDTLAVARSAAPDAQILELGNIGFGRAVNRGASVSAAEWLLICNPDLTFSPDFATGLLGPLLSPPTSPDARERPHWQTASSIAPRLLNADGSPQASVGRFPSIWSILRDQLRPRPERKYAFPQPQRACRVDWAAGACLLIRRDKFEAVGGFDEKYFLYVEDVDLQRRLAAIGAATWFVPEVAVVHHQPNANRLARPQVQRWAARGQLRYFAKFGSAIDLLAFRLVALVRLSARETLASRKRILQTPTGP